MPAICLTEKSPGQQTNTARRVEYNPKMRICWRSKPPSPMDDSGGRMVDTAGTLGRLPALNATEEPRENKLRVKINCCRLLLKNLEALFYLVFFRSVFHVACSV